MLSRFARLMSIDKRVDDRPGVRHAWWVLVIGVVLWTIVATLWVVAKQWYVKADPLAGLLVWMAKFLVMCLTVAVPFWSIVSGMAIFARSLDDSSGYQSPKARWIIAVLGLLWIAGGAGLVRALYGLS